MGDSRATASTPPGPDGVASLDELVERLRALRAWSGISYRELHRRLVRRRRSRGIPEEPAYATVYRCLQTGRTRLDIDLVAEIAAELTGDNTASVRWRQAYTQLNGGQTTAAHATVLDHLPDDLPAFTGRQAELDLILDHARQGHGVIAIEGMAGVGKTTLAIRAAHRILEQNDQTDIILSVHLHGHDPDRSPVDPITVLDGFLRHLGMTGGRIQTLNRQDRTQAFRELIADKAVVILLDDAADEDQIFPLLPRTPSSLVLVTSRRRSLRGVPARHIGLDVFTPAQAVEALAEHLGEPVPAEQDEVAARLVEQVGHLPLAVALIAARMTSTPHWTFTDHLDHLIERRSGLRLDTGIELVFATSYEALRPSLRRMLRRLALHPGRDCDAYAAAVLVDAEVGTAARQLEDLREAGLANERVPRRYELHDLVRMFAANRLREEDAPSGRRAALTRLFDYQLHVVANAVYAWASEERSLRPQVPEADAAVPELSTHSQAVAWLDAEWPNILAITSHAAENGWTAHVCQLSAVLAPYLFQSAKFDDAEIIHGHASRVATDAAEGVALKDLATARWHRGRRQDALGLLQHALTVSRAHDDKANQSRVLMNLAIVHRHLGDYAEAVRSDERALTLIREVDDQVCYARVVTNLGIIYSLLGRWEDALDRQQQGLDLSRKLGDTAHEARTLENRIRMHNRLGRHDDAHRDAEHALDIARRIGERVCEAQAIVGLGSALAGSGDLQSGIKLQRRGLVIAQDLGSRESEIYAYQELGSTLRRRGDVGRAAGSYEHALKLAVDLGDRHAQAVAHDGLARVSGDQGDTDRARRHAEEALRLYESLGTPDVDNVAMYLRSIEDDSSLPKGT